MVYVRWGLIYFQPSELNWRVGQNPAMNTFDEHYWRIRHLLMPLLYNNNPHTNLNPDLTPAAVLHAYHTQ